MGSKVLTLFSDTGARLGKDIKKYRMAILSLILYFLLVTSLFHAFCPMALFCGIPCPGCGMTRAVFYLLTGRWKLSFMYHPMAAGWVLLGIWFAVRRYLLGKPVVLAKQLALLLLSGMILVYIYRMAVVFPHQEPMVCHRNNLLYILYTRLTALLVPVSR